MKWVGGADKKAWGGQVMFADSFPRDFSRDYFVLVGDCNAKLAFLVALFSESKDTPAQILLLFDSNFVPFLLEKVELEISEFFWHEGSPC
jgi:hypothetical protein